MITRFNYTPPKKRDSSQDNVFYKWTYETRIKVINKDKDGNVEHYIEEHFWKKEKCSWKDFIESYNIGSVSEQVIDHLTKGTPLITGHTLPPGDYTKIEKGASIKREMEEKGITIEMLVEAFKAASKNSAAGKVDSENSNKSSEVE